jgi:mannitol-1-phosphate 5-dehydrogenase
VSTAVIVGPGRIACGQLAPALINGGHDVVLVARTRESATRLSSAPYELRLCDGRHLVTSQLSPSEITWIGDDARVKAVVSDADVVITSVLPSALPTVIQRLAPALASRAKPVDVLCLDNVRQAGPRIRSLLINAATNRTQARRLARHCFGGILACRIVTHRRWCARTERLIFIGDRVDDLVVDASAPPAMTQLAQTTVAENLDAHVLHKLYTFSAAHAAAAYVGSLKGYRYVHAAVRDPEVRQIVRGVVEEGRRGVAALFGASVAGPEVLATEILVRLGNAHLEDHLDRVGRDPSAAQAGRLRSNTWRGTSGGSSGCISSEPAHRRCSRPVLLGSRDGPTQLASTNRTSGVIGSMR